MNRKLDEILSVMKQEDTQINARVGLIETKIKFVWGIFLAVVPVSIQYVVSNVFGARTP
jgi:hypothetical protein